MRRWLLAWLVVGLLGSPTGLLWLVANDACACVRAACCSPSAPKRSSAHAGCHGAPCMARKTTARCHHSAHLRVLPKAGAVPPAVALRPGDRARHAAEPLPHSARDGFARLESPPPREARTS